MKIYTIGYEGIDLDDYLSLLREYSIETVVDVRALPLSRKAGFSKRQLNDVLNLSGFEYLHMVRLGCPRAVRDQYKVTGDWAQYTVGFLAYLRTQKQAIIDLSKLAESSTCALMCFEADHNFCHRSMVASAVKKYCGLQVEHIPVISIKASAYQPELI